MSNLFVCSSYTWCVLHVGSLLVYKISNFLPFLHRLLIMAFICGDSNVIKYLPLLKEKKSDPAVQATSVSRATNLVLLQDLLSKPTQVHALVIISALTNLITSKFFEDFDDMIEHCRATFNDVILWIQEGRKALAGFADTVCI
jgi:hypothetical protein